MLTTLAEDAKNIGSSEGGQKWQGASGVLCDKRRFFLNSIRVWRRDKRHCKTRNVGQWIGKIEQSNGN